MAGGIAAAVPTQHVDRPGLFVNLGRAGNVGNPGFGPRAAGMDLSVGDHHLTLQPPPGYSIVQVREGSSSQAQVTMAPNGPGDTIEVHFEVPDFVNEGDVVGSHNGSPVYETRFGLLWRSPTGLEVLVSGAGQPAQLEVIDGLTVAS